MELLSLLRACVCPRVGGGNRTFFRRAAAISNLTPQPLNDLDGGEVGTLGLIVNLLPAVGLSRFRRTLPADA